MALTPEGARFETSKPKRTRKTKAAEKPAKEKKPTKKELAAEVAAKAAVEAKEKAKVEADKKLPAIAKEVMTRLEKADKNQGIADDHRLAASLKLAEAKKIAHAAGVAFETWSKENIKEYSFETVRKLALIGGSENPEEALKATRERNRKANLEHRSKRSSLPKPQRGASKKEAVVDVALKALDSMPDVQRKKLLEGVARSEGLAIVPAAEARTVEPATDPLQTAKAAFLALPKVERKAFLDWADAKITADAEAEAAIERGEEPVMPEFLKRTRKTEPVADAEAKPAGRARRTRKTAPAA